MKRDIIKTTSTSARKSENASRDRSDSILYPMPKNKPLRPLVSVGFVSRITGLSKHIVRGSCERGELDARKTPTGHWRINVNSARGMIPDFMKESPGDTPISVAPPPLIKPIDANGLLMAEELSVLLRGALAPRTIVRQARKGTIPAFRVGRNFLFLLPDVLAKLANDKNTPKSDIDENPRK